MIQRGIVISESLLERGRHLGKPLPQFSLGMGDWEESDEDQVDALPDEDEMDASPDEDEMDALLLKAAELADSELPAESSDNYTDKILLEA